jgi:hypothetical protein
MPVLASIYALFLSFVAIGSIYHNIKDKKSLWYTLLDFVAELVVIVLFAAYWVGPFPLAAGPIAIVLYLFSLIWFVG